MTAGLTVVHEAETDAADVEPGGAIEKDRFGTIIERHRWLHVQDDGRGNGFAPPA